MPQINHKKSIIILHGWNSQLLRWQNFKNELVKNNWQVELPIIPGFGQEKLKKPWRLGDYRDWLFEYSKKINGPFFILGHSFGGSIGLKFASLQPKNLKGLILINSSGIRSGFNLKKGLFYLLAKSGQRLLSLTLLKSFRNISRRLLYKLAREKDYYQANDFLKPTLKNVLAEDITPVLGKITSPTLIIWGRLDKVTPLKHARILHQGIAKSQLLVFNKERHDLPFKQTKKLIKKINQFYQEVLR